MHTGHERDASALRPDAGAGDGACAGNAEPVRAIVPFDWRRPLRTGLARLGSALPAAGAEGQDSRALLHRRSDPSRSRRADGGLVRQDGRADGDRGPRFDEIVPPGGYNWWYVDAISDDGQHGLTIIAFLGSVFSPYYKKSGRGDPINHASLNVALYGPHARWAMNEHPRSAVSRDRSSLNIAASSVEWTGDALRITIEEQDKRLFNPWQRPVRGVVTVHPEMFNTTSFALDEDRAHIWHCLSPRARIEVAMEEPGLRWTGDAYLDHNRGTESLEEGFRHWHWSRAHIGREAVVCYEGTRRDGSRFASALRFDASGTPHDADLPMIAPMPKSRWGVERQTRADGGAASVLKTWEDSPFYARCTLASQLYGEQVVAVQESLDMDRFISPLVQFMLPYRMPRRKG